MAKKTLFVRITPKPEHFAEVRERILAMVPQTLAEPGCEIFELHEDEAGRCLYLYESFADEEALALHLKEEYAQAVLAHYPRWLAEPMQVTTLSRLSPGNVPVSMPG
ncbi:MAG TPA: putative quinol monooxygenase [Magnetospirillum sp.]|nr:putative quinol monooxygenase [Magnetospirillum sp.]